MDKQFHRVGQDVHKKEATTESPINAPQDKGSVVDPCSLTTLKESHLRK